MAWELLAPSRALATMETRARFHSNGYSATRGFCGASSVSSAATTGFSAPCPSSAVVGHGTGQPARGKHELHLCPRRSLPGEPSHRRRHDRSVREQLGAECVALRPCGRKHAHRLGCRLQPTRAARLARLVPSMDRCVCRRHVLVSCCSVRGHRHGREHARPFRLLVRQRRDRIIRNGQAGQCVRGLPLHRRG